jgi:hypothetical protein
MYHCDYCHRDGHLVEFCCHLFRGAVLGQEVQCLEVLGLRLRDHAVVLPGMVQVMINMILDLAAVTFSPIVLENHVFPHVVPAFLK